ncbi:MAG: DUF3090 family protein [Chloroflexi bacterium]|nr:DUF3090 family protein [Chloroflexota bacterium]
MIDFGMVDAVDAEAIGEPGHRTFRLRARAGAQYLALWMEKQQLAALGRAISQLLAERSRQRGRPPTRAAPLGEFVEHPDVDLQVVRLGLDFDADHDCIVLLADDARGLERGESPTVRLECARTGALTLVRTIEEVVAAGRPLCPLCGQPLEGSGQHFCPGSNGHSKELPLPARDEANEATDDDDAEDDEAPDEPAR